MPGLENAIKAAPTTLDQVKVGQRVVILSYSQATDLQGRLKELGLVRGTHISVERFAPLGDPIEIRVRGYHLAIRKKDAAYIIVSPLSAREIS